MTLENFNYRTNPMFLRNHFEGVGKWKIPLIPKSDLKLTEFDEQRMIGFDKVKSGKDEHYNRIVHFFLYDYNFENIWTNPDKYVDVLKKYKAILSPDYSMYIEMNPAMQLYNTFRNRWVGAYFAKKGIKVIPTVNWGLENTFDFCFNGIEKGSMVAVSTYMVSEHGNHKDQKDFFMNGYNELIKRVEPELIICYSTPFPEMKGNILYVDYDLSSWRHYNDDLNKSAHSYYVKKFMSVNDDTYNPLAVKIIYSSDEAEICKGMGSAYGGKWKPKKEADNRFIGSPGEIKTTFSRNGEMRLTKIGDDGYAVKERHFSVHSHPNTHSNPHDHIIDWSHNYPHHQKPINYFDVVPEFKSFGETIMIDDFIRDTEDRFESISDFKYALVCGREIEFEWNGKTYGAFREDDGFDKPELYLLCEAFKDDEGVFFDTADELLEYIIDDRPLKDFITKVQVNWRNL